MLPLSKRERSLNVVIATITRRRPKMLGALLESWARLERPRDCHCTFLVVENDESRNVRLPQEIGGDWGDAELVYYLEPSQGIPIARNRACKIALERNADVMLFIDDDETADARWLVNMVETYRKTGWGLIGGPVEPVRPPEQLTFGNESFSAEFATGLPESTRGPASTAWKPQPW